MIGRIETKARWPVTDPPAGRPRRNTFGALGCSGDRSSFGVGGADFGV